MDKLIPVTITTDNDGHDYIVPTELYDSFWALLELSEKNDEYDSFEEQFGKYRSNGSVQLYAAI